ncbi:MAG: alpha/beta hydrolase-fold protein [Bacteroidales bacterium]
MSHYLSNQLRIGLILVCSVLSAPALMAQAHPEVTLPDTELRTLQSGILGQELHLFIKLPAAYKDNPDVTYPVLYFTDGNRNFGMIANMLSLLETPGSRNRDIIAIGIGYKIRDIADWTAWRTRDLTPVNSPGTDKGTGDMLARATGRTYEVKSGGADRYLECLLQEVIPLVEANYRVSSTQRSLGGYSFGGLFALYTLLKQPASFVNYFAGSPSIPFGNSGILEIERESDLTIPGWGAHLYMSAGTLEPSAMKDGITKMAEQLEARQYPGLHIDNYLIENEDHSSGYPSALMRFLRVLVRPVE